VNNESLNKNISFTLGQADSEKEISVNTRRLGLGIDAGGTYTDAVVFDFKSGRVLAKSKALTTKWKYSRGIMAAVDSLPEEYKASIDQISISTTLVTNAIVELNQRPVGLLLMPNGSQPPVDLKYQPMQIIHGRITIGGEITEEIDAEEIRNAVSHMISHFHVDAFAVSGYGGSVNPKLELQVKKIIREKSGMEVCCGHELSGSLNFSIRAVTAVLNAGVMPIMEEFLKEMEYSMSQAGIEAPLLVVRGDGGVMSEAYAREFPVQTALSGPAASMAGAMFLTGLEDAAVIDVGGTTSDIGFLNGGRVSVCENGARIGGWDTHVKAVDMLTSGLGGDSEIIFQRQVWILGPRRIAPVSQLFAMNDSKRRLLDSLDFARRKIGDWPDSTVPFQFLYRTGKTPDFEMTSREHAIYDSLEEGPLMIGQLMKRHGIGTWKMVKSARLESSYCVQRAGLTPTDLFHSEGLLSLWDKEFAESYQALVADTAGFSSADLARHIRSMISRSLGTVLLEKMLGGDIVQGSGLEHILNHGNRLIQLNPEITTPVIGLGAPASLMLGDAVSRLNGKLTLCENGDVANAVGAITSKVTVSCEARVAVTYAGSFRILGIEGEEDHFETLAEAEKCCIAALAKQIRSRGRKAGTSASDVTITIKSDVACSTEGSEVFIQRLYRAEISGTPDLV